MTAISLSFPLGVYYAQSAQAHTTPEWPPSPVRLIGALIAAAHGPGREPAAERALVERLCTARPPLIFAPPSTPVHDDVVQRSVAQLRGASRWAPRNYFDKNVRSQAAVEKVGVAIGDRAVTFAWPDLALSDAELDRLRSLAADISFLGTSRSPVIATVSTAAPSDQDERWRWQPATGGDRDISVGVRVADADTLAALDARHELFRSRRDRVESSSVVPATAIGNVIPYSLCGPPGTGADAHTSVPFDPDWWGDMLVVPVDSDASEVVPRSAASYLVARAMRVALLGAFDDAGKPGEAPPILRARGAEPHCAIVPLAEIFHEHSSGNVRGIALILPSARRVPDLAEQRYRLETGLTKLLADTDGVPRRHLRIPEAGKVFLQRPSALTRPLATLDRHRYLRPSRQWVTATPVVHSRWPKERHGGLAAEIERDLEHVGLPLPEHVGVLAAPRFPGTASRFVPRNQVPNEWRSSLDGPMSHLRITFDRPVQGPILLGKARHFGLGLCVPVRDDERAGG